MDAATSPAHVFSRPVSTRWPATAIGPVAALLLYLACSAPLTLVGLGRTDVVTIKRIVAEGAREMARTGEYVIPRLHGEIYTYKPPLAYWLAHASFRLPGVESAWSLRLPFALCEVGMGWRCSGSSGAPADAQRGCSARSLP